MKKIVIRNVIALSVLAIVATSCSKDEDSSGQRRVEFPEQAEVVKGTAVTGHIKPEGREYIETVQKQLTLDPPQLIDNSLIDVIYPGSVLDGESFMNGVYTNLVITNPKEITISTTLRGKDNVIPIKALPILSDVRQKVNDLTYRNIDYKNTAALTDFTSESVTTKESFNKTFSVHVKANFVKIVSGSFGYTEEHLKEHTKNHVMVKVSQIFYTASVDPKLANDWGNIHNVGSYEPVYVSSVDYGRVAYLLLETDENSETIRKTISGSIGANLGKFGVEISAESKNEMKKLFNSTKMKVLLWGGDVESSKVVTDFDSFMNFLKSPSAETLVKSCVPISYRISAIKDNRPITIRTIYTENRFTYKKL
ncbi:thiol-activated cytolysin family protein [Capnocytophaga sp. G1920]|uniref:thiol-activated cytolysin family protein n=1 Tax=Capnocytophaga sp. G1920 TaxID=3448875 RepID=UPI003EDBEB86